MQRLRLTRAVSITGRDFWGHPSKLVIEPLQDETDWRWIWGVGGGVAITPKLFKVGGLLGRCVTLSHAGRTFHEFEHIAFLHALGLRGVRVWLEDSDWPPFMCQAELWATIKCAQQGPLKPYQPQARTFSSAPGKMLRKVTYTPDHRTDLTLVARVNYGGDRVGSCTLALSGDPDKEVLARVLSARTLGRPQLLEPIARMASKLPVWKEQSEKILWAPWWGKPGREFYKELAEHKVLDGAVMSFGTLPGSFLAGTVEFYCADHGTDLQAAQALYQDDTVLHYRKAV